MHIVGRIYFTVSYSEDEMRNPTIDTWRYRGVQQGKHYFDGVSDAGAVHTATDEDLAFFRDIDGLNKHLNEWAERHPDLAPPWPGQ